MPLLVIETGSDSAHGLGEATRVLLEACGDQIRTAGARTRELRYDNMEGGLSHALCILESQEVLSLRLTPEDCAVSNIMLYTPNFDQSRLPFWTLAADYRGALPEAVLASLQRLQGVRYVVITSEEM